MPYDPAIVKNEIARLAVLYPELQEDDEAWLLALESETNVIEALSQLVRRILETQAFQEGLGLFIDELNERDKRFGRRILGLRAVALSLMNAAQLRKAELIEATVSVRNNAPKLLGGADPNQLPDEFVRIKREENRSAIKAALEKGAAVEGYALSNAEPSISIRVR